ncbi:hypothetical protein C0J52_09374 [Blattella germanica]|nr:hypothetical protein C0J52_09374 [Blattella germanica]
MIIIFLVLFAGVEAIELCYCGCECPTPRYTNCSYSFFSDIPRVPMDTLVLNLEFNEISILENYVFLWNNLLQLQSLNLAGNSISIIERYAFSDMENLERLDLSVNKLRNIDPEIFANSTALQFLSLSGNKMLIMPELGHFLNSLNLKTLYLSNTNLQTLSTSTFQCMPNLENIYLDNNSLQRLDFNIFNNMVQHVNCANGGTSLAHLRNLKLSGNKWQCDCELQKVVLSYNMIEMDDALLCEVSNGTLKIVNELMCYYAVSDSKKSASMPDPEDCKSQYKAIFVMGLILGVLSAASTFIIFAAIVHFVLKCCRRVCNRTTDREGYESLE